MLFARTAKISISLIVGLGPFAFAATSAPAATPAPGYTISTIPTPTNFSANDDARCRSGSSHPAGCDSYVVTITNSGSLPADVGGSSPITIADTLPSGFTLDSVQAEEQLHGQTLVCSTAPVVECTDSSASGIGDAHGVVGELGVDDVIVSGSMSRFPRRTQGLSRIPWSSLAVGRRLRPWRAFRARSAQCRPHQVLTSSA